jgi:hypothetical protein
LFAVHGYAALLLTRYLTVLNSGTTALSVTLRSLILLGLFWLLAVIAYGILRAISEGRVKRFLTQPANMVPRSEAERRGWVPVLACLTAAVIVWAIPVLMWIWVYWSLHYH